MKKHESIYRELRHRIVGNHYSPTGRLPTESSVGRDFGVSVATVRRAMERLSAEGLLVRRQGRGTFVADRQVPAVSADGAGRQMVLFVALTDSHFYHEELVHMQHALSELGYASMQCVAPDFASREGLERIAEAVRGRDLAGIICGPVWHHYARIAPVFDTSRVPVVFVHPREPVPGSFVASDSATGAYQALCHLHDIGCRTIRYFGPPEPDQVWSKTRGIRRFLSERMPGAPIEQRVVTIEDTLEGGYHAAQRELASGAGMDGILTSGDLSAVGVMGAAREKAHRIPEDIAVMGFGRSNIAGTTVPPLTMMEVDTRQIAGEAVRILHEAVTTAGPASRRQVVMQPRLVLRASTVGSVAQRRGAGERESKVELATHLV